jgi:hypothetical protein
MEVDLKNGVKLKIGGRELKSSVNLKGNQSKME